MMKRESTRAVLKSIARAITSPITTELCSPKANEESKGSQEETKD